MKTKNSDIEKIEVFEGILKNSINEIKNNSDIIELKKNKALYSDRQVLDYVYFLVSGNVSLVKSNENGENKVIFLLNSGAMINEPLMRKNTSGIECWGFEDAKILRISFKTFDKIMAKDYILARNCMLFMEKRIRRLYRQLKNSTSTNIEKKLAAKLYRLGTLYGIESIKDKLSPAHKQIVLGKGTCSGVDTQGKFNPQNINPEKMSLLKQKWGIDDSDWIVGYTGRLVRDKGIMELVDAFDLVKVNNPRLKLLLVGMFEERDALPQEVQNRIKNDPQIVWTDFQNEDMEYFYAMMNVYVLMSYREGFPTGTLEAQSMGVPVITTRVTGCCDSIVEGETGVFVSREPEELGKVIKAMSEGEITFSTERTRSWVMDNFDNLRVWEEIKKLYEPTTIEG